MGPFEGFLTDVTCGRGGPLFMPVLKEVSSASCLFSWN